MSSSDFQVSLLIDARESLDLGSLGMACQRGYHADLTYRR